MTSEKKVIQCRVYPISYTLLTKKVKNINMRIEKNGEIVVSANPFVPIERIDDFVASKIAWIQKNQERMLQRSERVMLGENSMMLFGKEYKIKCMIGKFNHVTYDDSYVQVMMKEGADKDKLIANFMDKLCKDVFMDIATITHKSLRDYRLEFPVIKIRTMTSRWGSCMPSKHQITLNRRLIHYPIEFIEYVILHEFVHFIQPNHSKAFYNIIEYHMPDYKQRIQLAQ